MTSAEEFAQRRVDLAPAVRLAGDQLKAEVGSTFAQLASELESLSPAQAAWKPDPEEWSAAEVCDHVCLSTGMVSNIIELLARGQRPGDEDWDPPPQFRGDKADLAGVRERLAALPDHTEGLLDRCLTTDRKDVTADNSYYGEMNWREWYYFLRLHALAHLEQIEKLRGMDGFPRS